MGQARSERLGRRGPIVERVSGVEGEHELTSIASLLVAAGGEVCRRTSLPR
jgi:hypothetical protein